MMLEKGQISSTQLEIIMTSAIIGTGILSIPSIASRFAGHDMWMTPFLGSIIGFLTIFIVWKLHQLYPNLTPIEYSQKIVGKIGGIIFSILILFFYLHNTGLVLRQYTDFLTSNVMLQTPMMVFSVSLIFVSALSVRGGIEVIARTSIICTSFFMISSLVLLLLLRDLDLSQMLPFLENGFFPVIKGGLTHSAWFSEFFLMSFFFPFLNNKNNCLKAGMKTTFFVLIILLYVNFFVLTILGNSAANQFYPLYAVVRGISLFDFFENFEILITSSWVLGNYVKLSVFLYVSCLGLAQLLKLSDYRIIVFPLCIVVIFFSYWELPNTIVLINYIVKNQPFYFIFVQTILPFLLLIVARFRKKRSGS